MISIKSLNKYFNKGSQNEIHVIDNVSLDLPEKGMVAVFGKSGCGKTTLLNVIGGLDDFKSGSITVEGKSIGNKTDDIRNKYIGYIFQNYNLLNNETCFENVADALRLCGVTDKTVIEERVMAALKNVGMDKYKKRTPDTLSGGQQQRIAIARAIVKNPRIILADEPTGNLDEANTIAVMDLLKQLSREHLVILVTHEANLVDYYCDTVIELSDGKIISVRNNEGANGYFSKDKNDIYLGELQKSTISDKKAEVEYYGDLPREPIKLRIVNSGGKTYLQINSSNVQILDATSEVKLKEGTFDHTKTANDVSAEINMEKLPPVKAEKCGRLFTFGSAVKSGYAVNFKKKKVGKKLLLACMILFAAVFVMVCAFFGNVIGQYISVEDSYNHNTFYVEANEKLSEKINSDIGSEQSAIDYVGIYGGYVSTYSSGITLSVQTAKFETYTSWKLRINTVALDETMCREMPLLAGKKQGLAKDEIVVTSAFADEITENDSTHLIKRYEDVIGVTASYPENNYDDYFGMIYDYDRENSFKIAGVVRSSENAVYFSPFHLADKAMKTTRTLVSRGVEHGVEVQEGQINVIRRTPAILIPQVGDKLYANGVELTVGEVTDLSYGYDSWLESKGIKKDEYDEYMKKGFSEEYPDLKEPQEGEVDNGYFNLYSEYTDKHHFEWVDYYYDALDEYMAADYKYSPTLYTWLYAEKGIKEAKYALVRDADLPSWYFCAKYFEKENGRLPSYSELMDMDIENTRYKYLGWHISSVLSDCIVNFDEYNMEFERTHSGKQDTSTLYVVSDADYIKISKRTGKTTDLLYNNFYWHFDVDIGEVDGTKWGADVGEGDGDGTKVEYTYITNEYYLTVHSTNPQVTERYLKGLSGAAAIFTPSDFKEYLLEGNAIKMIMQCVSLLVILVLLSLCMYFIMRSSLMSRIKEVGIYRAIGVSKRNILFKFLIECLVLIALTVLIGYIVASLMVFNLTGASIMSSVIFYPLWYAGIVLLVLLGICTLCGVLPVLTLLNNTPSRILSKYDI